MKVLALIPARSGSKGVKDKNIHPFRGLPLMAHTIQNALQSQICDEVFVCTDSQKYASIAKKYGASVPFLRSQESASDTSKSIDCIIESLQKYKQLGKVFDVLLFLQPTSPLRNALHIQEAYNLFLSQNCQSLASVCKVSEHPIFMRQICNHSLSPILHTSSTIRRQDLQELYRINGAIYLNLTSSLTSQTSLNDNVIGYIMDKKYSLDIDAPEDFQI